MINMLSLVDLTPIKNGLSDREYKKEVFFPDTL